MRTADFDYSLPEDLIAQYPALERSQARLLVLDRTVEGITESTVLSLPALLNPGDLLVLNNSRVFPARLRGIKDSGGGKVEILLLERLSDGSWRAMLRPGKRVREGTRLQLGLPAAPVEAVILQKEQDGLVVLQFPVGTDVMTLADRYGEIPLPPYIHRSKPDHADRDRYQTIYAKCSGSVAAPTAGLHFSSGLLKSLEAAGVRTCEVTLHVGMGTFAPVKSEDLDAHPMHEESYEVTQEAAALIEETRSQRGRVVAVGTTSLRVLESVARKTGGPIEPGSGKTRLFIRPPATFAATDALLTNFHLPRSTLLMLVCAFASPGSEAGTDRVLAAYQEAIRRRFRFFSYGDAMLIR